MVPWGFGELFCALYVGSLVCVFAYRVGQKKADLVAVCPVEVGVEVWWLWNLRSY